MRTEALLLSLFFLINSPIMAESVDSSAEANNGEKKERVTIEDRNKNEKISLKEGKRYLRELPGNSTCAHDYLNYRRKLINLNSAFRFNLRASLEYL